MNLEGSVESLGNLSYLRIRNTSLLPTWINPGSLLLLSFLEIEVAHQVRREDIQVLRMLQALRFVKVDVSGDNTQGLGSNPRGAMPRLEIFYFRICPEDFFQGEFTTDDLALDLLPSLRTVSVGLYRGERKRSTNKNCS